MCSHIENLVTGVRVGYIYKMRCVYSHFPINLNIEGGNTVEIRNFMGEKRVRRVPMEAGCVVEVSKTTKDQIEISGNDVAAVSLSASSLQIATNIRKKDLRKFLDGGFASPLLPLSACGYVRASRRWSQSLRIVRLSSLCVQASM